MYSRWSGRARMDGLGLGFGLWDWPILIVVVVFGPFIALELVAAPLGSKLFCLLFRIRWGKVAKEAAPIVTEAYVALTWAARINRVLGRGKRR
jgi:hypothetical protein